MILRIDNCIITCLMGVAYLAGWSQLHGALLGSRSFECPHRQFYSSLPLVRRSETTPQASYFCLQSTAPWVTGVRTLARNMYMYCQDRTAALALLAREIQRGTGCKINNIEKAGSEHCSFGTHQRQSSRPHPHVSRPPPPGQSLPMLASCWSDTAS